MIKISLREDLEYTRVDIREKLISEVKLSSEQANQIFDELANFINKRLRPSIQALLDIVYKDLDIESPLPSYNRSSDTINFGQWIGAYSFESEVLGESIRLHIEPKIGSERFSYMLNDSLRIIEMIGLPSMEPIFTNLKGFGFARDIISYSILLQQYTDLALREGFPPIITEMENCGEGVVGTPNYTKTLSYIMSGKPLAVVTKRAIGYATLPAIILVKFHMKILSALKTLINRFKEQDAEEISQLLLMRLYYHTYILSSELLYPFIFQVQTLSTEDAEIVEEAKKQARTNWWLRTIIDLYMAFNAKIPVSYNFDRIINDEAPLQPLPTSKVYELWVLKLLTETMYNGLKPNLTKNSSGFELSLNDKRLIFNLSVREKSKVIRIIANPPRPDYILLERNRVAVADAKYKDKLGTGDIERMIAYIIDYAEPQYEQQSSEVKGFFVMLKLRTSTTHPYLATERTDIIPKLRIYMIEANPSDPNQAKQAILALCNKVFS